MFIYMSIGLFVRFIPLLHLHFVLYTHIVNFHFYFIQENGPLRSPARRETFLQQCKKNWIHYCAAVLPTVGHQKKARRHLAGKG